MANPRTQAELLDVVERQFPPSYIDPIKNVGPGWELFQAAAKIGERCSLAVSRSEDDAYIMTAAGPVAAQVEAIFYRANDDAGAVTVLKGTLVKCSSGGQVFRTTEDAVFGSTDLEVAVNAIAIGYGYEWNIKGKFVAPNGDSSPGELDTVMRPLQSPPYGDPTIQVRNDDDADGLGHPGTLDALGYERDVPRTPGEGDVNYRSRIRTLPDTISPAAFRRQMELFFKPYGLQWWLVETWQHEYQECYDAPDLAPTVYENYNKDLFTYDDPRTHIPIANRWLDESDVEAAGVLEIEAPQFIREYGFVYDDPGIVVPDDFVSDLGRRAVSAFDFPDVYPPPMFGGAYDADDRGQAEMFTALAELLDGIKAAGVKITIHIAGDD